MFCYAAMLGILMVTGKVIGFGWPYFIGLGVASRIALYHYALIRGRARENCFKAFCTTIGWGLRCFAGSCLTMVRN